MTEPRDELGAWLGEPVEPLAPRPGSYERIRKRARRRKRNQAITATAMAAAVVAGLVAAPRLSSLFFPGGGSSSEPAIAAAGQSVRSPQAASGFRNKLTPQPTVMGGGQPMPNGFKPSSATFVGLDTGWALGTLSTPCVTVGCLALARTDNTGASWYSVQAPPTVTARAATGVSQVRFLNRDDGWIFGPELWWTRDGGQDWQQAGTGGMRVVSLEAVRDRAFAVFARCPQSQPFVPNGGGCQSYQLYSAVAGTAAWQRVPGATSGPGAASVVLGRDTGYLLAAGGPTATLASGPVDGHGQWAPMATPCQAAASTPSAAAATPGGTLLATAAPDTLFAACGAAGPVKQIAVSTDGGRSWRPTGAAPLPGTARSMAATPGGTMLVIAASTGLYVSADSGATWKLALTGPPGGFGYVGMTDVLQGFAIPVDTSREAVLFTMDGGSSWRWSTVPGSG
jgi:hypothetical protein